MREYEIRHMERLREDLEEGEIAEAEFRRQYDPLMRRLLAEHDARSAPVDRSGEAGETALAGSTEGESAVTPKAAGAPTLPPSEEP